MEAILGLLLMLVILAVILNPLCGNGRGHWLKLVSAVSLAVLGSKVSDLLLEP